MINSFSKHKILPADFAAAKLQAAGDPKPYSHPLPRQTEHYSQFVRRFVESSLIDLSTTNDCVEYVEMFFELKKDGRLRLVIDSRRSNCHFEDPSPAQLCTGDSLGRLELDPEESMFISMADLKDAFYHFSLPQSWRKFFGLRPLTARHLGVSHVQGCPVSSDTMLFPRLAAIPMGWSWAP